MASEEAGPYETGVLERSSNTYTPPFIMKLTLWGMVIAMAWLAPASMVDGKLIVGEDIYIAVEARFGTDPGKHEVGSEKGEGGDWDTLFFLWHSVLIRTMPRK